MNFSQINRSLKTLLELPIPPVAMAHMTKAPEGIPFFKGEVPSSCTFWHLAEESLFVTRDLDHMNCPVGAMVMGLKLTPKAEEELQKGIAMMCDVKYLDPQETEHIPHFLSSPPFILYGPLALFPVMPEVLLLWVLPAQAMLLREAIFDAAWTGEPPSGVFGRPACTALAIAANNQRGTFSFGCTGMRAFTEVSPSHMLVAFPGKMLEELEKRLKGVSQANCAMQRFYEERKKVFSLIPKLPPMSL